MVFGAGYGEQADARIVEYGFRHIGAAQDVGDGDGHDADDGGEHVPQAVAQQDPCPSEPLGPRQQHVITADFIQQLVADHVSVIPQVARHLLASIPKILVPLSGRLQFVQAAMIIR